MTLARISISTATALGLLAAVSTAASADRRFASPLEAQSYLLPTHTSGDGRFQVAAKIGGALKGAAVGTRMARDRKNGSEAEEQTQPSASGDDQASSAPTPDSTGEVANGPFKLTIPAQPEGATAPAATPPVAAVPAAPVQATPAPTGNADVSNTPGLRAGGAKAARSGTSQARDAKGRPAADAGPTRTIIENGNGSTAAPSTAAAAAGPGAAAPTASVGGSCFAGCYTPTSAQVGKHEPARNIRSAPGNSGSNAAAPSSGSLPPPGSLTCVAGCGDNRSTAIARTAAGAPPADNAKGTGRITILRGVSRTKAYGVRD